MYLCKMIFFTVFIMSLVVQSQACLSQCIAENAQYFLGTPYKSGTLDINKTESLVTMNTAFDCVTFVDYVLALSLYQCDPKSSFEDYLQSIRYRDGKINGYGSRIHYTSEWILQGIYNGYFTEITEALGGRNKQKKIDFMSKNSHLYPSISKENCSADIIKTEEYLSQKMTSYIPKQAVQHIENQLRNGDIVAITTHTSGLDISHIGIIIIKGNKCHFLHASDKSQSVTMTDGTLFTYLLKNPSQEGIRVLRPIK